MPATTFVQNINTDLGLAGNWDNGLPDATKDAYIPNVGFASAHIVAKTLNIRASNVTFNNFNITCDFLRLSANNSEYDFGTGIITAKRLACVGYDPSILSGIRNGVWIIQDYASASLHSITDCDFSGGVALLASGSCQNVGTNNNVTFATPFAASTTFVQNINTDINLALNWDNGLPSATKAGYIPNVGSLSADLLGACELYCTASSITFNGFAISAVGELRMSVNNGSFMPGAVAAGSLVLVGYDPSILSSIDGGTWTISGHTEADTHDITNADFSPGNPLECESNCNILTGNTDVVYWDVIANGLWDGSDDSFWSNGNNWSNDATPGSADNVLFTVGAPANVDLDADSDFGTIDFTTFVRTFNFNNWTLNAYGDITMGAGMTAIGPWFTINANSVIDTQGIEIWKINNVGTVKLTLGYDLDVSRIFWNTSGNEFDFGGKQLNLKSVNDEESLLLHFNLGSIISGVIGAGISVDVQAGQDGIIYGANTELPPIVLTGAGDGEINIGRNLRTVSFTMESGSLTFSSAGFITSEDVTFNGGTLLAGSGTNTIGGDFYSAVSMPGGTYNVAGNMLIDGPGTVADSQFDVVGTRIIKNRTVSGCTSTNEVDCTDGCIDGGGNDANFIFPIASINYVWDGESSGDATDGSNWDPDGVPTQYDDASVSSGSDTITGGITCRDFSLIGFTGSYEGGVSLYRDAALDDATMASPTFDLDIFEAGNIDSGNYRFGDLDLKASSGVRTVAGTLACTSFVGRAGSTIALGINIFDILIAEGDEDGWYFITGSAVTYSAGAKLMSTSPGLGTYIDLQVEDSGTTVPPVEIAGGVFLYKYGAGKMETLSVSGGGVYLDGAEDLETTGNMTIDGAGLGDYGVDNMGGSSLIVGGDLSIFGAGIVNGGNINCAGTAEIHDRTVSNMTSTGPVDCTDGCTDGGGNDVNFDFGVVAPAPVQHHGFFNLIGH